MKFKNVKIGQEFIYNDLLYVKTENNLAFNSRYGSFCIHKDERVKLIFSFTFDNFKKNVRFFIPIIAFTVGCLIGLIVFWIIVICT